ncbi:MAG: TonB C-terminal domain-containing protein [Candidatus Rariloculaceae bacterium]
MGSFFQQHRLSVLISIVCHVVLAASLTIGFNPSSRSRARLPVEQIAIEAMVVDESQLQQELERLEQIEQAEVRRQLEQEQQARDRAEAARLEREDEERRLEVARLEAVEAERQEELRLADLQRQREEEQERLRQEAAEAERREAERVAELERQREQEAERQRQAAAAAAQRAEMEAELQRALAAEDDRRRAQEAGLLDEYIRLIENRIQQNWIPPASAIAGLECIVNVTQIPSGDVVDVQVGRCTGDDAVVRSIEAAVLRSSPLPRPPVPSLFERNLEVVFNPIM